MRLEAVLVVILLPTGKGVPNSIDAAKQRIKNQESVFYFHNYNKCTLLLAHGAQSGNTFAGFISKVIKVVGFFMVSFAARAIENMFLLYW